MELYGEEHATELSAPYWAGLREGQLTIQQCSACGCRQHYPRYRCMRCGGGEVGWSAVSGAGVVLAGTSLDRTTRAEHKPSLPMPLALVRLEEQVLVMARLADHASTGSDVRFDGEDTLRTGLLTMRSA